jgi:hypothetical protein
LALATRMSIRGDPGASVGGPDEILAMEESGGSAPRKAADRAEVC